MSLWKTASKALATCSAVALLASPLQAADLEQYNAQWQSLMNNKDAQQLSHYYDAQSLLGQYPYDASKNLVGLEAISGMFSNGPFNLEGLNADVDMLASAQHGDSAILLKAWKISFAKGGFSGLALEVLDKQDAQWIRRIDLGAGGLKSAGQFSEHDSETDNSAFDNAYAQLVGGAKIARTNLSDAAAALKSSEITLVDNLLSVAQGETGLLISKVSTARGNFLTFNALQNKQGKWTVTAQLVEKL
ncbi:MAG: hypothetical protein ACPG4U_02950 [Pseudomonadales bacterium]